MLVCGRLHVAVFLFAFAAAGCGSSRETSGSLDAATPASTSDSPETPVASGVVAPDGATADPVKTDVTPAAPPRTKVLLTFDDATSTSYSTAYPMLKTAGIVGTIFAPGSLVGSDPWFMTLDELKEMYDAGWDVANHTWSHQALSKQIAGYWRSGSTATIAFALPHGYRPGDTLQIYECGVEEYDGTKTVDSVPDPLTITFSTPGLAAQVVAPPSCRVFGGVPLATIRSELQQNRRWLLENGFVRATDHLSYPYGAWDDVVVAIWRDEVAGQTARVVGPSADGSFFLPSTVDGVDRYQLPSWDLNDGATAAEALAEVDAAIAAGASLLLMGHGVAAVDPVSTQIRTAELQALVDGLAARRAAGKIDIVTISEWFASAR